MTGETARSAAARPAEREADFAVGLGDTRSYHATHRTLAAAIDTVHDGFQLGRWLRRQRQHARTDAHRGGPPSAAAKALDRIDPWWCPPWSLVWQRAWQHIHDQVQAGHRLDADHHFRSFAPPSARLAPPAAHPLRRPPPRPAVPPGRHRPHPRDRPHPPPQPVRRDRTHACPRLRPPHPGRGLLHRP
ncbi:helicase associated domain-containing protein [Streptomyces sp. NPDC098090]|uniref:helicase associated domain-containing protein n=1 Tax=Streptomyces sp. NPDC098090 TaxID=3366095 RepID=UPI00380B0A30